MNKRYGKYFPIIALGMSVVSVPTQAFSCRPLVPSVCYNKIQDKTSLPHGSVFVTDLPNQKLLIDKVESFLRLPDGWDGYYATAPSVGVVEDTIRLIKRIGKPFEAYPISDGRIQLEIENDEGYLELEIREGHQVELYCERAQETKEKSYNIMRKNDLHQLLKVVGGICA